MARFTLTPYVIRVKKHGTKDDYFQLDALPNNVGSPPRDMLFMMQDCLTVFQDQYIQGLEEDDKVIHLDELRLADREITGTVRTGASGLQSDLYDMQAHAVAFTRQVYHAELYPFYFLVHVPQNSRFGIVILQRFEVYGVRTVLFRAFASFLKGVIPEATFEMNPLTETAILRQFMDQARLTEIRAIKYTVPTDKANEFGQGLQEDEATLTYSLTAHRKGHFGWFYDRINPFLDQQIGLTELVQLKDFEPDTVKIHFDLNGVRRTFDLSNPGRVAPYYDITSDVTLGPNGFPTYDSVNRISHDHLERFLESAKLI